MELPLQWIAEHSEAISALTDLGTLAIWAIYLQVFVSSYRRQLRATLIITRGVGSDLDARCLVSNMSSGPIYISSVFVRLETSSGTIITPVTDVFDAEKQRDREPHQHTRQGPLQAGESRDIGSFRQLIEHALHAAPGIDRSGDEKVQVGFILVEVVGLYGSEDLPIGARRGFDILAEGVQHHVHGRQVHTEQIRTRRQRRELTKDLQRDQ
ncbi:hypothetical protein GCM10007276_17900 [Agaricicola taiwanensis]|uniref:Uncharacterized protein n=2 Tax=Agaricicola taiwanensis TaxID=591372 RepID=A0A8J2VYX9_9RHOB|nr:hypothetical protein GCM10007276_17900 [Agaricicola taiwanensis]